jgi:hypothetical protein
MKNNSLSYFAGALLLAGSALAQTTTPTPTTNPCPSTTTPVLNAFTIERVLTPNQFTSTLTPTFPPGLIAAVNGPNAAVEIREGLTYNTQNQLLTLNLFPAQVGSTSPVPIGSLTTGNGSTFANNMIFASLSVKVDRVYVSCNPGTGVMFVGTVATNSPVSSFGDVSGAPIAVGIGLSAPTGTSTGGTTTNPSITNVSVLIPGRVVEYSAAGVGTVNFTNTSVTPPGTSGGIAIAVLPVAPTTFRVVDLVASSNVTTATYKWTVKAGAADVANQNTAHALGYIQGGAGTYVFTVTVSDASGNVLGSQDVTVMFL